MKTYLINKPGYRTLFVPGGIAIEFDVTVIDNESQLQDKITKQLLLTTDTTIAFDQVKDLAISKMSEYEQAMMLQE